MSISYLRQLKEKCPADHDLAVMTQRSIWIVKEVKNFSVDLLPLRPDLSVEEEVVTTSKIKIGNFWYMPKNRKFGAAQE